MGFTFSTLDESDGVSTGSDFSLDKILHGLLDMYHKGIKSLHEFLNNSLFGVISGGYLVLKLKSGLLVVSPVITNFFSGGNSLREIGSNWSGSKGEEFVHGLLLEEVGVSRKLVEGFHLLDFSKRDWHSLGFPVGEVLFEEVNSGEGFIVLSASGDENEGCITSFVLEFSNKSVDLFESVVDEINVVGGVDNFLFNEFSVGNSVIIHSSVGVHDAGKFSDSGIGSLSVEVVLGIKSSSLIEGRLFETVKYIHNSINSESSSLLQFHELFELWREKFGIADSQYKYEGE